MCVNEVALSYWHACVILQLYYCMTLLISSLMHCALGLWCNKSHTYDIIIISYILYSIMVLNIPSGRGRNVCWEPDICWFGPIHSEPLNWSWVTKFSQCRAKTETTPDSYSTSSVRKTASTPVMTPSSSKHSSHSHSHSSHHHKDYGRPLSNRGHHHGGSHTHQAHNRRERYESRLVLLREPQGKRVSSSGSVGSTALSM